MKKPTPFSPSSLSVIPSRVLRTAFLLLGALILCGIAAPGARAASLTVNTFADELDTPAGANISLREAIRDLQSGGTILFDTSLNGKTIILGGTQLLIDKNLTIDASALAGGLFIEAFRNSRVFEISPGSIVAMNSLTLSGGISPGGGNVPLGYGFGGAIYNNQATLNLSACTISGSSAYFGGCIASNGEGDGAILTLSACTLAFNDARFGGAIYNSGNNSVTLSACTIANNTALESGGGICSQGVSGNDSVTLSACTLSGNSALCGGGIWSAAAVTLGACTLSGNSAAACGGGIYLIGLESGSVSLNLSNSILAGNTAPTGPDLWEEGGGTVTIASGQNLLSTFDGLTVNGTTLYSLDPAITLVFSAEFTPLLSPLGDYGGPTMTRPPLPGNPAIDAGGTTILSTDQRGAPRTVDGDAIAGALVDIGAVEFVPAIVTNNNDSGAGSLRSAITFGHTSSITLDPNVFTGGNASTITLGGTQLIINKDLTIDASALPGGITIDANGAVTNHRVMQITPGHTVTLRSLTLTGGNATGDFPASVGGAIYSDSATLTLSDCTLSGNSATSGGGIYSATGSSYIANLALSACTLSGNSATSGGGIYSAAGFSLSATLSLSACTLSGNSATSGGGIYSAAGSFGRATLALSNSILAGNTAPTGPDLREIGTATEAVTTASGKNLLSSTAGSNITPLPASISIVASPLLAGLGDYGGPTQTMPPLPGSQAINAAVGSTATADQRGFPIVATADIGAAEFQGNADLARFWSLDWDGDGNSYGIEQALGSDPFVSDPGHGSNPVLMGDGSGKPLFTFGRSASAAVGTTLRVARSPDLSPGSFVEIFRITGSTTAPASPDAKVGFTVDATSISVTDLDQLPGKAFYRIETVPPQ